MLVTINSSLYNSGSEGPTSARVTKRGRNRDIETMLVMGLSKGSVIFVKLDQIELIYARFSVHKQKIEHI